MYKKIQKFAKKKGLSMAQIAEKAGIYQSTLTNLKNRDGDLSFRAAHAVAKVLGIRMEDLA